MKKYNFDEIIERRGSGAIKTDKLLERYGRSDLKAAWVADMDFPTPDFIMEALSERLKHPIFGYSSEPEDYRPAIIDWEKDLHNLDIKPEWISYIPGIVKGIGMVINVFTQPGDNIVITPPVYHPFRIIPELNGRKVVNVPLVEKNRKYYFDFHTLERFDFDGGIFILSNPHNPAGRIWEFEELKELADICLNKNILVISDEIHADMALWGNKHVPFISVSDSARSNSITFCAPSKTFNIPGIVSSFSIVPDQKIRDKFYGWLKANEFDEAPIFSHIATIAAYREGREWRKQMLEYIEGNVRTVEKFFESHIPEIKVVRPDISFLVWLDCKNLNFSHAELIDMFVNHAKVALNDGAMFGKEGEGFMRLNVAMPKQKLTEVLESIEEGLNDYKKTRK